MALQTPHSASQPARPDLQLIAGRQVTVEQSAGYHRARPGDSERTIDPQAWTSNIRQQRGSVSGFNKNWDGSWEVAVSQDDAGWYAEFRIPFSTLRSGGSGTRDWGFNISRRIRRGNEEAFWASAWS